MLEINKFIGSQPLLRILCLGITMPATALTNSEIDSFFIHLSSPTVIISILVCFTLLLIALLIHLQQKRILLARTTLALKKSERHLQLIGNNLPNVTLFRIACFPDNTFSFLHLSEGYETILGLNRKQVMQDAKLAFDHIHNADIPILRDIHRQALKKLTVAELDIRVLDTSGSLKWLQINAVPHREKNTLIWDGFIQDISENKIREDELLKERRYFRNLMENMTDHIYFKDLQSRFIMVNKAFSDRSGAANEDLLGKTDFDRFTEDHAQKAYKDEQHILQTGEPLIGIEEKETWPDGRITWVSSTKIPLKNTSGEIIGTFGVSRDITHQRKIEIELRKSQEMLQLIMDTIPMAVFWKDKNSVYLGCNETYIKEYRFNSVDDVIGKTPLDLFDPETATNIVARDQQVISSNEPILGLLHSYPRADGSTGQRETSKMPLRDEDGLASGVLAICRDITEQNQAEVRLKQTLEDMERFNQLMRGRERRTLELKAEINRLLELLGQSTKYKTTSDTLQ